MWVTIEKDGQDSFGQFEIVARKGERKFRPKPVPISELEHLLAEIKKRTDEFGVIRGKLMPFMDLEE